MIICTISPTRTSSWGKDEEAVVNLSTSIIYITRILQLNFILHFILILFCFFFIEIHLSIKIYRQFRIRMKFSMLNELKTIQIHTIYHTFTAIVLCVPRN